MHGFTEVRYQQHSVKPLLVGKITQALIGIAQDNRQFRIVVIDRPGNRKLQITVKLEETLQVSHAIEKLGKANSFVNIVTGFHELRSDGVPDSNFQVRVYDLDGFPFVYALSQTPGFTRILDDASEHRMSSPFKLLGPFPFALTFRSCIPTSVRDQGQPDADKHPDDPRYGIDDKLDQPGIHCDYVLTSRVDQTTSNATVGSITSPISVMELAGMPVSRLCSRIKSSSDAR